MKLLVTVASKHGATGEIGELIADALRDAGHHVTTQAPETLQALDRYDAIVLGSAVYAGRWMKEARNFADRHASELARRPVWIFSSGPIGDPPLPEGDHPETLAAADRLGARGHRTFAGHLARNRLGLVERTIVGALKAPDGDFRDLDAIRAWADEIVAALRTEAVPA